MFPNAFSRPASGAGPIAFVACLAAAVPSPAAEPEHAVSAYAETTDAGGVVLDLGFDLALGARSRLDLGVGRAESALPGGADSVFARAGLSRTFDPVWLRLGLDHRSDPDLLASTRVELAAELDRGPWVLGLDGALQRSDFVPQDLDTVLRLRERDLVVRATADCRIDGGRIGGRLARYGERWIVHAAVEAWFWDDTACAFDAPGLEALTRTGRAGFVQLADRLAAALAATAVGRTNQQAALLDHGFGAGVTRTWDRWSAGLDVFRGQEAFFSEGFTVWTATLRRTLPQDASAGLVGGVSHGGIDTVAFVGLELQRSF